MLWHHIFGLIWLRGSRPVTKVRAQSSAPLFREQKVRIGLVLAFRAPPTIEVTVMIAQF